MSFLHWVTPGLLMWVPVLTALGPVWYTIARSPHFR